MQKFHKYLIGAEFTWIANCSGLAGFLTISEMEPSHIIRRWQFEILQYNFTLVHRPEKMLTDCNFLSRYNTKADKLRTKYPGKANPEDDRFTGLGHLPITITGPKVVGGKDHPTDKTPLAECGDRSRYIWIVSADPTMIQQGMRRIGITPLGVTQQPGWRFPQLSQRLNDNLLFRTEWIFIPQMQNLTMDQFDLVFHIVCTNINERVGKGAFLEWAAASAANSRKADIFVDWARGWLKERGRTWKQEYDGPAIGGATESNHVTVTIHREDIQQRDIGKDEAVSMEDILPSHDFGYNQYLPVISAVTETAHPAGQEGQSVSTRTITESSGKQHPVYSS